MRCRRRRTRRFSGRKRDGMDGEWPLLVGGARAAVASLWWVTLAVTALIIVPLLVRLLRRVLQAARAIERSSGAALAAASGILTNTAALGALDQTVRLTGQLQGTTGQLKGHSAAMAETFIERLV